MKAGGSNGLHKIVRKMTCGATLMAVPMSACTGQLANF
jgi:hypothetical protein